jgi:hypothetical protein
MNLFTCITEPEVPLPYKEKDFKGLKGIFFVLLEEVFEF